MSYTYWTECVGEALCEAGISVTDEQLKTVVDVVQGAHEMYSEAHGYDRLGIPQDREIKTLRAELQTERDKVTCKECKGTGQLVFHGPYHSSVSSCHVCHGEGRA